MNVSSTIQKSTAAFFLLVMMFSATPKQFLHQAFANHTDSATNCKHKSDYCFHQAGFNCHFDNLVVSENYVFEAAPSVTGLEIIFNSCYMEIIPSPLADFIALWSNKGPPAIA